MSPRRVLALCGVLLLGGCLYHARERTDEAVCALAAQPFDLLPKQAAETKPAAPASSPAPPEKVANPPGPALDVQTTALMQPADQPPKVKPRIDLKIPPEIPGSEAPLIKLPKDPAAAQREIQRIYPELPPLPAEPVAQPGPDGQPYTPAALQQLA